MCHVNFTPHDFGKCIEHGIKKYCGTLESRKTKRLHSIFIFPVSTRDRVARDERLHMYSLIERKMYIARYGVVQGIALSGMSLTSPS